MGKLGPSFFVRPDVAAVARELLGKYLLTRIDGAGTTGGMIVETEAYGGVGDRACHAWGGRRTARTSVMYRPGGVTYVYLCYGLHALLNVVTGAEGDPCAVLIRALKPEIGAAEMLRRRGLAALGRRVAGGPGALTQALGIDRRHNGLGVAGRVVWIEDRGVAVPAAAIEAGPRVGVAYAGPDARRPWRFRIRGCAWTSPAP